LRAPGDFWEGGKVLLSVSRTKLPNLGAAQMVEAARAPAIVFGRVEIGLRRGGGSGPADRRTRCAGVRDRDAAHLAARAQLGVRSVQEALHDLSRRSASSELRPHRPPIHLERHFGARYSCTA